MTVTFKHLCRGPGVPQTTVKSAAPLFGILIANLIAGDEIRFGFLKIFKGEKKSAGTPKQGAGPAARCRWYSEPHRFEGI